MRWHLAMVLVAMAIIAGGCGGESDDIGHSPTAIAATPTAVPTSDPAGAETIPTPSEPTPEPTATPAPMPEDAADPLPSDAYFTLDRVLDISIEIATEDWDTLRHQTRTWDDLMAEIEEYNLTRPFASIYSWFSATVTVDGETHTSVGVRKKGFIGSQSDTKPSLKLRFDKYVDDQSLGGVVERMTLNNGVQDRSMVNTCLTYRIFTAAGHPAPRCNFATVSVNGKHLGLYAHVEEIKAPFLLRHFDNAEGNLYEGNISDFLPVNRGTIEKKTNEDAADWSDIDSVVLALQDQADSGLEALGEIVDLDRFLTFWAIEVLVGHWDGYTGGRNNYWFYRALDGPFVFIPWGADQTFHLQDDPNPFDNFSNPPPSVLAVTAIPNRLYSHPDWRDKYAARLKEILEAVWDEQELLAVVDQMAAIVQEHAHPEEKVVAAADTERVRKFILKRRGEILADLTPRPPEWPEPDAYVPPPGESGTLEISFETTWGSNQSDNPWAEGTIISLVVDGSEESVEGIGVFAGHSSPDERELLPTTDNPTSIVVAGPGENTGSLVGMTLAVDPDLLADGATLVIGQDTIAGGVWSIQEGASTLEWYSPFTEGVLELSMAGATLGDNIAGTFSGVYG